MMVSSKFTGYLRVVGIAGKVSSALDKIHIWGKLNFDKMYIKGDVNQIKTNYDRKLEIQILPSLSALQVRCSEVPKEVLAGEVLPLLIEITNTGPNEVRQIYLGTDCPRDILFEPELFHDMPLSIEKGLILQ